MARRTRLASAESALRKLALGYPEAREDHPWGETAVKVGGKVFVFLHHDGERLSLTVKLPWSSGHVSSLPFAEPSGYGLGKSGWITARFAPVDDVPVDLLGEWIDESYRAVAPKKLVAALDGAPALGAAARPRTARRRKR